MDYSISGDAVCDGCTSEAVDFDADDRAVAENVDSQYFTFK